MESERGRGEVSQAGRSDIQPPFITDEATTVRGPPELTYCPTRPGAGCEGSGAELLTADWQQTDISEEDMDDSDIEETVEVLVQAESCVGTKKSSCVVSAQGTGRRKEHNEEHNLKERIRRANLKDAVCALRNQLRVPTKRPSTKSVLEAAQAEIQDLSAIKEKDEQRLEELKNRHNYLQFKLEKLLSETTVEKGVFPPGLTPCQQLGTGLPQMGAPKSSPTAAVYPRMGVPSVVRPLPPSAPPHLPPMAVLVGPGLSSNQLVPPSLPLPAALLNPSSLPLPAAANFSFTPSVVTTFPHTQGPVPPGPLPQPCLASFQNLTEISPSSQRPPAPPSFSPIVPGVSSRPYVFNPLPISFCPQVMPIGVPGLIGTYPAPQVSLVGGVTHPPAPNPGVIFTGVGSWTDNPANQKPYFPVKVFSHSPPTLTGGGKFSCPPPSSSSSSPSPAPVSHHINLSPQSRPPAVPAGAHSKQATVQHSRPATTGTYRTSESSSSSDEEIGVCSPPSQAEKLEEHDTREISALGKILPRNEEELFDVNIDYGGGTKRARREFRNSSSDSDSGGSCSSGPERGKRYKAKKWTAAKPRGNKSKGNGGKFRSKKCVGYRLNGRHSPQLQVAGKDELAGGGESFLVNLTSNYHVSMEVVPDLRRNGTQTLPACPSLDKVKVHAIGPKEDAVSRGKKDIGCGWLDEIAERSVRSFKSKFPELSAEFLSAAASGDPRALKTPCVQ